MFKYRSLIVTSTAYNCQCGLPNLIVDNQCPRIGLIIDFIRVYFSITDYNLESVPRYLFPPLLVFFGVVVSLSLSIWIRSKNVSVATSEGIDLLAFELLACLLSTKFNLTSLALLLLPGLGHYAWWTQLFLSFTRVNHYLLNLTSPKA